MKECLHTTDAAMHCHARDQNAFIHTRSTYATADTPRKFSRIVHLSANDARILSPYPSMYCLPEPEMHHCTIQSHRAPLSLCAIRSVFLVRAYPWFVERDHHEGVRARSFLNSCGAQGLRS